MPTANITVTADTGPDIANTTKVYNNCSRLEFDFAKNTFNFTEENGQIIFFEYNAVATVTYTISGSTATITIS